MRWRGHPITERLLGLWVYCDTGIAVAECPDRVCGHCRLPNQPDGHDACLGNIPGVMNACCGHGDPDMAYCQLSDGRLVPLTETTNTPRGRGVGRRVDRVA